MFYQIKLIPFYHPPPSSFFKTCFETNKFVKTSRRGGHTDTLPTKRGAGKTTREL